jgi:hypothetical protein
MLQQMQKLLKVLLMKRHTTSFPQESQSTESQYLYWSPPSSLQVITTNTSFWKEPLFGVRIGDLVLMIIGETMLDTLFTVKPSLVVTALISVPVLVTDTGDMLTDVSSVGSVPSNEQCI